MGVGNGVGFGAHWLCSLRSSMVECWLFLVLAGCETVSVIGQPGCPVAGTEFRTNKITGCGGMGWFLRRCICSLFR
jgi:hypothetical protein